MQRFEFSEGTSNKFWEVMVSGSALTTRWGKIGGSVNQRVAELGSPAAAIKERDKLIREKTGKGYLEVGAKAKTIAARTASMAKPAASNVKPSELALTTLRDSGGYTRLGRVIVDGKRALTTGDRALGTTDGKTFHNRSNPGQVFAMAVFDGVWVTVGGGSPMVSRDFGDTWKEIKTPPTHDCFTIARDSKGTYWMGCHEGLVLMSNKLDGGWKKAPYKGFGKMLHVTEVDGKLFWSGADPGVWDGKKYTRLKGMKKKDVITRIIEMPGGALVAIGDSAVAYRSENRGASWKSLKVPVKDHDLEDCAIVAGALIVVGGGGTILKSTNEGKSFTKIASQAHRKLWGIGSWGDGAFICGDSSVLLKLASPKDTYWKGAKDELAPPPPEVDRNFVPPTPAKNREEAFARQHAEAVKAYKPTADKRPPDAKPDLAKLVEADAEGTTDALEVYIDWLQGQGDPRGELAAIQLKQGDGKDKALAKAEKKLFATHAAALLGKFKGLEDVVTLTWRGGFIHTARIATSFDRDPDYGDGDEDSAVDVEALFGELLDHPSARFMRDLTVGLVAFEENSYDTIAKLIGKRHLPALRSLYLGDFSGEETELSWSSLGKLEPVYAAVPNLKRLAVRSGSMNVGKIVHPTLEHFEVTTGGLDSKSARAIGAAVWPSLRSLSLMVGRENYGGTTSLKDMKPLLAGENLPRLQSLGLKNLEFTDDLIEPLAVSKILPQLEVLDLSMGTLSDEGIRRLYRYQKAFQHLAKLDIGDNFVTKDGLKLLRTLKIPAEVGRQRDDGGDPTDRYASIGE
ncbi:MAG: WGR domain-containing protein [Myxococcota bacterium]|nr:WGR domain-containing protein [Myxococcota bacterium]